jgi:nucleoside-diphosphate-sugar epimerase
MDTADRTIKQDNGRERVLVTGASGFIGGHVARYFAGQGVEVSCLVREKSDTGFIQELPVSIIKGDITDPASLARASRGMDAIVHVAGKVDDWGSYDEFYKVNVTGTLNVLQAALSQSVSHVIITGSVSSYGEEDHIGLKDETSPYNSHYPYFLDRWIPCGMNHYRDTKALCTRKAGEFAARHSLNVTVIEPCWVYGENEFSSGFYEYLKTAASGMAVMPGSRSNIFHVIYAEDLARSYYLAFRKKPEGFHRFIIGNKSPENMAGIYKTFCSAAGLRIPVLIPKALSYPLGVFLELIYTVAGSKKPPVLTRGRVNMFYDNIGYATSRAKEMLGFEARVPLEEGIARTVKWYRDNHYL